MRNYVRVGVCQTPDIIGDPSAALAFILRFSNEAEDKKVDLLLFPECFLSGYIVSEDYLADHAYNLESKRFKTILEQLEHVKPTLVFGVSEEKSGKYFNSAVVVSKGKIIGVYRKTHLISPGEDLFTPGEDYPVFEIKGLKYGINVCYDVRFADAVKAVADQGAKLLLLPAQNMMRRENAEKWKHKHSKIRSKRIKDNNLWLASSDVTGTRLADRDGVERISYGPTLIMNSKAEIVARVPLMTIGLATADIPIRSYR